VDNNRIINGSNNRLETVIRAAGGNGRTAAVDDDTINGRMETLTVYAQNNTDGGGGIDAKENKMLMM